MESNSDRTEPSRSPSAPPDPPRRELMRGLFGNVAPKPQPVVPAVVDDESSPQDQAKHASAQDNASTRVQIEEGAFRGDFGSQSRDHIDPVERFAADFLNAAAAYLNQLLDDAYNEGASDIHIHGGCPAVWRLTGSIRPYDEQVLEDDFVRAMVRHAMSAEEWRMLIEQTNHDFSYAREDGHRFRINAFETHSGMALSIRVLNDEILDFHKLNLPPAMRTLAEARRGLILVTGVTGSGKTTTLATIVKHINNRRRWHIITIEDPIEIVHANLNCVISQREIGRSARSFEDALRAALRQDPDVILVGELRDMATIRTALAAAETGHLVLSTIHAGQANLVIERILSYFSGNELEQVRQKLANNLRGVIAQRLLPRSDTRGMAPAVELLMGTSTVLRLIREDRIRDLKQVMQNGEDGMQTFDMSLLQLLRDHMIDLPTALEASDNPSALKRLLAGGASAGDGVSLV